VTVLSVLVNHKFGAFVVFISVIYHCQNPVEFANPLYAELNPICHLLALLGAQHTLHVSRIRVNGQVLLWEYFLLILPSLWITRYLRPALHLSYLNEQGMY
jgi:hypothetical protein